MWPKARRLFYDLFNFHAIIEVLYRQDIVFAYTVQKCVNLQLYLMNYLTRAVLDGKYKRFSNLRHNFNTKKNRHETFSTSSGIHSKSFDKV